MPKHVVLDGELAQNQRATVLSVRAKALSTIVRAEIWSVLAGLGDDSSPV